MLILLAMLGSLILFVTFDGLLSSLQCAGKGTSYPFRQSAYRLLITLLFAGIFLPNLLTAQPQTFFYRAWTQTGGAVAPGFINRVVTIAGSGTAYYTANSVLISTSTIVTPY